MVIKINAKFELSVGVLTRQPTKEAPPPRASLAPCAHPPQAGEAASGRRGRGGARGTHRRLRSRS
jgi:hypothetical protein